MSTDLDASFNEQFININMKLKKRFMRKPNISEAANEFIGLAIQCEHSEQPTFAGHAYVGAAKCEATAGNFFGEAEHYVTAARQFMKAEKKLSSLKFYSPDRENLEAAIGCFLQAFSKYPETSLMRASILMEIANDLVSLNHKAEALAYYEQALEYVTESTMRYTCLRHKLDLEVDCGKYNMALETAHSIVDSEFKLPEDVLSEIQVSRILLSLLEKPSEDKQPDSLKHLFMDLLNDNESELLPFNPDLQLKLQSIISTALSGDVQSLVAIASDTKRFLTQHQEELLQNLVTRERMEHLALT